MAQLPSPNRTYPDLWIYKDSEKKKYQGEKNGARKYLKMQLAILPLSCFLIKKELII